MTPADLRLSGRGRILAIVANGPSVAELDLSPLRGHPRIDTMSINKPVASIWPTAYWLFCDISQHKRHEQLWNEYEGIIINTQAVRAEKPNRIQLNNLDGFGFSRDLTQGVHVGRSSSYVAMQVAAWIGYDSVYILGCDMAIGKNGETHFYGINPDVSVGERVKRFADEARHFEHAAKTLSEAERERFVFCSSYNQHDFVNQFRRVDHSVAVESILRAAE